jgi:hypothetical protein
MACCQTQGKEQMIKDEALRLALEALKSIFASTHPYRENGTCTINDESVELSNKAISAIEEALAQSTWVGLTDEDKQKLAAEHHDWESLYFAVQAKLKEKNT